jgi:hypothetical protein
LPERERGKRDHPSLREQPVSLPLSREGEARRNRLLPT